MIINKMERRKKMKQNWIRFKPFAFNSWCLFEIISRSIINRRSKFLDDFFRKHSKVYHETFYNFYGAGEPFYDGRDFK